MLILHGDTFLDNVYRTKCTFGEVLVIVQQDAAGRRRGDGEDHTSGVPGREGRVVDEEHSLTVLRLHVPQLDGIVLATRDEVVLARVHSQGSY